MNHKKELLRSLGVNPTPWKTTEISKASLGVGVRSKTPGPQNPRVQVRNVAAGVPLMGIHIGSPKILPKP